MLRMARHGHVRRAAPAGLRKFSWLNDPRNEGYNTEPQTATPKTAKDITRIQSFLNHIETNPVSKKQVYDELRLVLLESKAKDMDHKLEITQVLAQAREADAEKNPTVAKQVLTNLIRVLGFGLTVYLLFVIMRKVDFKGTGGIGGDMDMFKDNFQEYHPLPKGGRSEATNGSGDDSVLQAPDDADEGSFQMLWGKKEQTPNISFDYVSFADVLGNADAKEELSDLVDFLKDPQKYKDMGLTIPKGVLLSGPPGTGKTLLARALAGEAEVPFINVNGSSFVQMFAGLGAQRVRRLFARARELSPCIIFIDEIDALGTRRDQPQNYSRQTLNQLLGEMDGFAGTSGVIVVGATNLAHTLDSALTRPGRFDRTVEVAVPDKKVRKQIIQHYLKDKCATTRDGIDFDLLAANTTGYTGAELFNMVNRAGIESVKLGMKSIPMSALMEAQETMMMGRASKDKVMSAKTKQIVAYHEAGHALVSLYTKSSNPIYKATILPRGGALGFVAHNRKDEHLLSKESMLAHLDVCMGGRAAEEIIFGTNEITQGASNDFQQATGMARNMVARYGMSSTVGKVFIDESKEKGNQEVYKEVKRLTDDSYARATQLLTDRADQHRLLAEALLRDETLSVEQIKNVIGFKDSDMPVAVST